MNPKAQTSLICGVVGILMGFLAPIIPFTGMIGIALGIYAIISGMEARKIAAETGEGGGLAMGGLATGCLAILIFPTMLLAIFGLAGIFVVLSNM